MPRQIKIDNLELHGTVRQVQDAIKKHFAGATQVRIVKMKCVYRDEDQPRPAEPEQA